MKTTISIIVLLSFFLNYSKAQTKIGERFTRGSVTIFNYSYNNVSILLGSPPDKLNKFTLKPIETWISPIYNKNPQIKIITRSDTITYQLILDKIYRLFFDSKKKYWDLREITDKHR